MTDESRAAMEEMLLEIARQHAVQIDAEGPKSTLGTHHFWAIEARDDDLRGDPLNVEGFDRAHAAQPVRETT